MKVVMAQEGTYSATLFRGWDYVRLTYTLEPEGVLVHERRWWGAIDRRVRFTDLSDDVRRVWGRQGIYRWAMTLTIIAAMALALEFAAVVIAKTKPAFTMWLMVAALLVGIPAALIMYGTRKPREWTHFKGAGQAPGLFLLKNPRDAKGHERIVKQIRKALKSRAPGA